MPAAPKQSIDPPRPEPEHVVSLEQLAARLGGRLGRRPNDTVYIRETARVLRAMEDGAPAASPTLVCEPSASGMRIVDGGDALRVALELRARAVKRGDHAWAWLLGRRLTFRVVTAPAGTADAAANDARRRSRRARSTTLRRAVRGAAALANS